MSLNNAKGTEDKYSRKNPIKPVRILLVIAGFISLGVGIAGIFLPLLPTTPLVLLSAACFLRGSDKLYCWITKHKTFGAYIHNYLNSRTVPARTKPVSIALLWVLILISIYFSNSFKLRILLLVVACGVSIHLLLLKTTESLTDHTKLHEDDHALVSTPHTSTPDSH